MQKMKLSLVLWNCNGKTGKVPERNAVFRSTYDSWEQEDEIPTVVLAQELRSGGLTTTWRELSKKSNSFNKCETACFFLMGLGQEIKLLDSGDLQRIMPSNDRYDGGIARIHCGIVTLGAEKILICSWHGQHMVTDNTKKDLLRKMLIFVDKVKEDQGCVAALVGGDFNLDIDKVIKSNILQSVQSADLYRDYTGPLFRPYDIIDYVIAWPKTRFIKRKCGEIETHPKEEVNPNPRMFDHALIRYDFTVILKGEWEGEGKVEWGGKCGEGKVTLTGENYVKVTGVKSNKWKGRSTDLRERFEKLNIEGGDLLSVNCGEKRIDVAEDETVTLTSKRCEGTGAQVHGEILRLNNGEQTVTWNGTGSVEWRGKGKATWVGGKLEKWEGSQSVRCADDRPVQWNGNGEVELEGDELKHDPQGTWESEEFRVDGVRYSSAKSGELKWSGRGAVWKVTGKGAGTMLD